MIFSAHQIFHTMSFTKMGGLWIHGGWSRPFLPVSKILVHLGQLGKVLVCTWTHPAASTSSQALLTGAVGTLRMMARGQTYSGKQNTFQNWATSHNLCTERLLCEELFFQVSVCFVTVYETDKYQVWIQMNFCVYSEKNIKKRPWSLFTLKSHSTWIKPRKGSYYVPCY